jgi:hypothetical protein
MQLRDWGLGRCDVQPTHQGYHFGSLIVLNVTALDNS